VMDADGSDLHQVSFNQSNDLDPTLLADGRVLFSRWDHAGPNNAIHLYTMNPDGSDLQLYYGAESHLTGTDNTEVQFVGARATLGGDAMAIVRPFDHPELGGAITVIDTPTYVENTQPIADNAGMSGPAQVAATPNQVRTDLAPSQGGRFSSAFPLWDGTGRVLATWSICRVLEPDPANPLMQIIAPCTPERLANAAVEVAPPLYGVWMYNPADQTQLPIVTGEEGVLIADVVAAQPRRVPINIPDKVAGVDVDADLVAENVGIVNIRSVYDIDGVSAVPIISAVADPVLTPPAQRPARFLRIEKAVSIPDEDLVDLADTAFGPNNQLGMREIIGYAPIEPDGSVRVKVPAQVALAITVLDADGRRISPRHQNWLQVVPGEELTCNGCHAPQSGLSHGRRESFDSVYAGAAGTGVPFPNSVVTFSPDFQETMAETRTRVSCQSDCAALELSVNVLYVDEWTNSLVATPGAPITFEYAGLTTTPPVDVNCAANWSAGCRIVINYEQHIHPLWSAPRMANAVDVSCAQAGCHAPTNAMAMTAVPAGQLDLTDGPSPDEADHLNAYRELLFGDNRQVVMNGALVDEQVPSGQVDANGNPILVAVAVAQSMSSVGANASGRFFSRFGTGGTHAGYLTLDELRLISEWLDIGAQYYNNPFDPNVPVN
jgi:Hydrazine synthase alpha subunit middle domain